VSTFKPALEQNFIEPKWRLGDALSWACERSPAVGSPEMTAAARLTLVCLCCLPVLGGCFLNFSP